MSKQLVIAIDGFSSTGKSTMARELAKTLGLSYIDTGAMYRAVALYALRNDLFTKVDGMKILLDSLDEINLDFQFNPITKKSEITLNGEIVENEILGMEVSGKFSEIAKISAIRKKLVSEQQSMGSSKGLVMDGRDIGTVVFPNADLKIFMTASEEVRVERRYNELKASGKEVSKEEVAENISKRDAQDSSREDSPLKMASDARVLDNSDIGQEEQLKLALSWAQEII